MSKGIKVLEAWPPLAQVLKSQSLYLAPPFPQTKSSSPELTAAAPACNLGSSIPGIFSSTSTLPSTVACQCTKNRLPSFLWSILKFNAFDQCGRPLTLFLWAIPTFQGCFHCDTRWAPAEKSHTLSPWPLQTHWFPMTASSAQNGTTPDIIFIYLQALCFFSSTTDMIPAFSSAPIPTPFYLQSTSQICLLLSISTASFLGQAIVGTHQDSWSANWSTHFPSWTQTHC